MQPVGRGIEKTAVLDKRHAANDQHHRDGQPAGTALLGEVRLGLVILSGGGLFFGEGFAHVQTGRPGDERHTAQVGKPAPTGGGIEHHARRQQRRPAQAHRQAVIDDQQRRHQHQKFKRH